MKNIKRTKYLACIYLILCFTKLNAQPRNTTLFITGDGTNPKVIIAIPDKFGINTIVDTVKLDAAKKLKYVVKLNTPQNVFLRYGERGRVQLWLTPGNSLNITVKNSPEFSGPDAVFAKYFAADADYWKKIDAEYHQRNPGYEKEAGLHSDKYFAIQDSTFIDRIKFLKGYLKQANNKGVAYFIEQQESNFYYSNLYYKMTFNGSDYEKFKFIQNKYKIVRSDQYGLSDVADFDNAELLSLNYYRSFFCFLTAEMARKKIKNSGEKFSFDKYLDACMSAIDEMVTRQSIKNNFRAVFLNDLSIDIQMNKDVKMGTAVNKAIDTFLNSDKNKNLELVKEKIEKIIKDVRFAKGAQAPEFFLKDTGGKVYTLNDFKGKKLIFDMGASWCGPCIAAIPDWNKLAQANKDNQEVVFVSLSLDNNETEWAAFMKKHPTEGLHLYAGSGFKSKFALDYEIIAIPHYLLIDENGRIASYSSPRLDGDEVLTFLKHN